MSVKVTQADREAAAEPHLVQVGEPHNEADLFEAAMLREGNSDDWPKVQAFARHRSATDAELAQLRARVGKLEEALEYIAETTDDEHDARKARAALAPTPPETEA